MRTDPTNQIPLSSHLFVDSSKQESIIQFLILELVNNVAYLSFVGCLKSIYYTQLSLNAFVVR